MRGWRSRVLVYLIVYFGGFATAIYYLAPASDRADGGISRSGFNFGQKAAEVKSSEVGKVAGAGMKKFVGFAEEKAKQLGEVIKQKLAEQKQNSGK